MAERDERIEIRVTQEEKDELREWIDDTGQYGSMSRLLRSVTLQHIRTDGDTESESVEIDNENIQDAVEIALSPVTKRLERIENGLAQIDSTGGKEEEIDDLAQDIAMELPVASSVDELPPLYTVYQESGYDENQDPLEFAKKASTATAWSGYVDADLNRVRRALVRATESFPDVEFGVSVPEDDRYRVDGDPRRYYRVSE